MNKKLIMGLGLIGCIFIGSYGVLNKDKINITTQNSNDAMKKLSSNQEIYKSFLSTTNGLVKGDSAFERTMIPKQNIINTLNTTLYDSNDNVVIENLEAWLNGDFSNIVEFHNYLDKLSNNMLNQVTEPDIDAIDAYKEYLGL